jgi:lipoate-protein ligase A
MLNTLDYYLPDVQLLEKKTNQYMIWIPDKTYIVLGASNNVEDSLYMENVVQDNVTILKRPSGGQTVILTPNNIMISAVFFDRNKLHPKDVFRHINRLIISAIEKMGIHNLSLMGISDIAISGKKILGSAIYRTKNALLYHAVLNLGEPAATFERYLKHPHKEPDYRHGRSHTDFVTSLKEKGYNNSAHHMENMLSLSFECMFCL